MRFTELECRVLGALIASAKANGHDFGFVEDARAVVHSRASLGGVVASLVKKGVIQVTPLTGIVGDGSCNWTQFCWPCPEEERRAFVAGLLKALGERVAYDYLAGKGK